MDGLRFIGAFCAQLGGNLPGCAVEGRVRAPPATNQPAPHLAHGGDHQTRQPLVGQHGGKLIQLSRGQPPCDAGGAVPGRVVAVGHRCRSPLLADGAGLRWLQGGTEQVGLADHLRTACHPGTCIRTGLPTSDSRSLDQRLRPLAFLTAMASALRCPTSTTSRLPRVTPV